MNDYDELADAYEKTHEKPDKKFSMIPTALKILGPLNGKRVIDVGCGDGFFAKEFSREAESVIGIDNSEEQILKTRGNTESNVSYTLADMNSYDYSGSDRIFSPFVLNYLDSTDKLKGLFQRFYDGLNNKGVVAGIIDFPKSEVHEMRRFGSIKRIDKLEEGCPMDVELYNGDEHLVTLHSFYHTKKTIETLLGEVGFDEVTWYTPIISKKGIDVMGKDFWEGYIENCDLAYFSATKDD